MKKTVMIMMTMLMVGTGAQAQYSDLYYHSEGDTMEFDWPTYYHCWWDVVNCYHNGTELISTFMGSGCFDDFGFSHIFYTPVPLRVVGIAVGYRLVATSTDTVPTPEYLYLMGMEPGGTLDVKARATWNGRYPVRYMHLKGNGQRGPYDDNDSCCIPHNEWSEVIPISERYFDSAVTVTDTFYVGFTTHNRYLCVQMILGDFTTRTCDDNPVYSSGGDWCDTYNLLNPQVVFYESTGVVAQKTNENYTYVVFPIVEVDTTEPPEGSCVPVSNVEAIVSGTTATVTWDDFPNYTSVTLKYGRYGLPQNTWQTAEVTGTTMHVLTGLDQTSTYGVALQAYCEKKAMPWSEMVYFYVPPDTSSGGGGEDSTGVSITTPLSEKTFVQPNPASDEVTVSSVYELQHIDVHDLSGVMVYSEAATGHRAAIDIGYLRQGTYIVTIHTRRGVTHKRFTVVR